MLDTIASITSGIYTALSAFAVAAQALIPVYPWHAAIGLSLVGAGIGGACGLTAARFLRRR